MDFDELEELEAKAEQKRSDALRAKNLGNSFFQKGQHSDAIKHFDEAISLDPTDATFFSNRSAAHYSLGHVQEAINDAKEAITIRPLWGKAHFRLGKAYELKEQWNNAISAYEKAKEVLDKDDSSLKEIERALRAAMRKKKGGLSNGFLKNAFSGDIEELSSMVPKKDVSAEVGTYRPPSEGRSLLIRVTRGCQWNKCTYCRMYKDVEFSFRPTDDILKDIDTFHEIFSAMMTAKMSGMVYHVIDSLRSKGHSDENINQVALFLESGAESAFLQDADAMHVETVDMVKIVKYLRSRFPMLKRVTTYARSDSVNKKSVEELTEIRQAGLDRLHIGFETGSMKVIALCKKGVRAVDQIRAGQKSMEAGFELSWYQMPGLGGKGLSDEHAIESAKAINQINPSFVRLRTYAAMKDTPGMQQIFDGKIEMNTEEENIKEIRKFIEHLDDNLKTVVTSADHAGNLISFEGKVCTDKKNMLRYIDKFLEMSEERKDWYIVGKRSQQFHNFEEFVATPEVKKRTREIKDKYGSIHSAWHDFWKRDTGV